MHPAAIEAAGSDDPLIAVRGAWSLAMPAGSDVGAVYLEIENEGASAERLIRISTPLASKAEVHAVEKVDGVAQMRPHGALELGPGHTASLRPGGMHIMVMGLRETPACCAFWPASMPMCLPTF